MDKESNSDDLFEISDLEWIKLRKALDESEPETFQSKLVRKCKESPFIPIGTAATTACLLLGIYNFGKGDSRKQQLFMRGRVLAQGFTIAAFVSGILYTATKSDP